MSYADNDVIERAARSKEHPYTMVSNALIRDKNISPNCRWMLIFLLSNKADFKIEVKRIVSHVEGYIGRDSVYKLIEEAILEGYIFKHEYLDGGKKRYKYFLSEDKDFQNIFQFPGGQDTGGQLTASQGTLRNTTLKNDHKEERISSSSSPSPTSSKEEMMVMMKNFLTFTDEEFEKAWKKYSLLDPESIPHPKAWFATVIENLQREKNKHQPLVEKPKEKSEEDKTIEKEWIEKHKRQALEYEQKYSKFENQNKYVIACDEFVRIVHFPHTKEVRYDVGLFQWIEQTGWE